MAELKDVNHIHALPDFVQDGLDYIPSDIFENKENALNTIKIFLERLRQMDLKLVELAEMRTVLNAEGENLDEIGRQLGIFRNGLDDPEYRAVIMILTGNNSKSGTREDVIATLRQLFGEDGATVYKGYNYRVDINIFNTCMEVTDILPQIIDMLPLVTHLRVVENNGYPFGFEGDKESFGWGSVFDEREDGPGGMAGLIHVSEDDDPFFA